MAAFQKLRDSAYKSALGSNYLEQGKYAEALASTGAEPEAVDAKTPTVSLVEKDEALPGASTVVLADLDARTGAQDVVSAGRAGLRVLRNEQGRFADVTEKAGLAGVAARVAVAGDYDNDGLPDLLASGPAGVSLLHNEGGGRFKAEYGSGPALAATPRPPPPSSTSITTATSTSSWRPPPRKGPASSCETTVIAPSSTSRRPRSSVGPEERSRWFRPTSTTAGTSTCSCSQRDRPRALQEHAGRQLQGPGGRAGPRGHGAVHERRRRRREQGRLHRFLPRRAGRVLARPERRPGSVPGRARAGGGRGRARRAARSTTTTTGSSTSWW